MILKTKRYDLEETVGKSISKGYLFEDFEPGRVFEHHWGRTLLASDNVIFCSDTMQYNPLYFNVEYARSLGYREIPIHPLFVMNVAGGMSVEDMSEGKGKGGIFLGIDDVRIIQACYPGDTITSSSKILERYLKTDQPGWGVVTWRTRAVNQHGEPVIEFDKSNLVACEDASTEVKAGV